MLGDRRLGPEDIQGLAELPGKSQLQARVVGTIQGPMASLVGMMNGLLSQIAYVVDQRAQQLGGGGEEAPAEAAAVAETPAEAAAVAEAPAEAEAPAAAAAQTDSTETE